MVENVLIRLEKEGFVNDRRFIEWYVDQHLHHHQQGWQLIKQSLLRLGINRQLLDEYFINHPFPEEDQAKLALISRWRRWNLLPTIRRRQKAFAYLARRGFSYSLIKKTIAEIESKE